MRIQNQTGPHQNKWNWTGTVIEVRQFHQYLIRIDRSGRQTLRNRKFLRKFIPMYQPPKRRSIIEDIACLPPNPPPDHDDTAISPSPSALNPTPTNSEPGKIRLPPQLQPGLTWESVPLRHHQSLPRQPRVVLNPHSRLRLHWNPHSQ